LGGVQEGALGADDLALPLDEDCESEDFDVSEFFDESVGFELLDGEDVEGLLSDDDAVSFFFSSPLNNQKVTPPIAASARTTPAITAIITPEPSLFFFAFFFLDGRSSSSSSSSSRRFLEADLAAGLVEDLLGFVFLRMLSSSSSSSSSTDTSVFTACFLVSTGFGDTSALTAF
jgi:hypothetical protein